MTELDPSLNWVSILLVISIAYYVLFSWISAAPAAVVQKPENDDQDRQ